ncbi:MAG: cell filamentation protein Fic [Corynebacterium sp.]|nr:cell filamentation protein Fic [Corynebacterium sp.]
MTAEQLVDIAKLFCMEHKVRITNYAALAAAATAASARIDGIAVHATVEQSARALGTTLQRLEPLSAKNREFALTCMEIFLRVTNVA